MLEVSFQNKAVTNDDSSIDDESKEKLKTKTETEKSSIKASLKKLQANRMKHNERIEIINKEKALLQAYADGISAVGFFQFLYI